MLLNGSEKQPRDTVDLIPDDLMSVTQELFCFSKYLLSVIPVTAQCGWPLSFSAPKRPLLTDGCPCAQKPDAGWGRYGLKPAVFAVGKVCGRAA